MKTVFLLCCLALQAFAQKHELGFTLGRLRGTDRGGGDTALQANYGYRLWSNAALALSGEIQMLASPLREVTGPANSTRDYSSLYVTPGIRVKLNPDGRVQPYGAIGGGYALYEQSTTTLAGAPNSAPRHIGRGALMYGAGADVPVLRWLAIRGEVRDFYTGNPAYNRPVVGSGQHNLVAGGGFVLRFGK